MSASAFYRPVSPEEGISITGTSSDETILREVFGNRNLRLDDREMLYAMHLASRLTSSLWNDLADALDTHDEIEVWFTY